MSQMNAREIGGLTLRDWINGAASGFIGGFAFALVIQYLIPETVLLSAIPSLYGISRPVLAIGWLFHSLHSVLFGLLYAKIANYEWLREHTNDPFEGIICGMIYGFCLLIIFAVLYSLALFLEVPVPKALPLPYVGIESYLGHLIFGGILGGIYAILTIMADRERVSSD